MVLGGVAKGLEAGDGAELRLTAEKERALKLWRITNDWVQRRDCDWMKRESRGKH